VDRGFRALFAALGLARRWDYVDVEADAVRVRMGWAFLATVPRSAIRSVEHHANVYGGWGVHGLGRRWLVNGSSANIVELTLDPRPRAWVLGFLPVRLGNLMLSLEDPDAFMAAVRP
jgi:hypothetical protein